MKRLQSTLVAAVALLALTCTLAAAAEPNKNITRVPVVFTGGYETDARDHGRPVALIAAALGVPPEVFREAFTHVHPAGPGSGGPTQQEARANKTALMNALGKYGVTNDRLDEVSNFYRYPPGSKELWKHKPAVANALVQNGVVTGFEIINGGSGYLSAPTLTVPGVKGVSAKVKLSFDKTLEKNGAITAITLASGK